MGAFDKIEVTMLSGVKREFYGTARVKDEVLHITGAEYHADTVSIPLQRIAEWKTVWR